MVQDQLRSIDWDFIDNETGLFTHSFHPYPAKFIPQIPRNLIELLSERGDSVLDPFCGSGTTLVEALICERSPYGLDINPLSVLISKVKSTPLAPRHVGVVNDTTLDITQRADQRDGKMTLFHHEEELDDQFIPDFPKLDFWFDDFVIDELALIKSRVYKVDDVDAQDFMKAALSGILVTVSRQDSDTRYTRREKNIRVGDTIKLFAKKIKEMISGNQELHKVVGDTRANVNVGDAQRIQDYFAPGSIDLVVTSPPYPNAYTYHLYHRNRMYWLDIDPYPLKQLEIGTHRKYSAKNGATVETFKEEMRNCFSGIREVLRPNKYCCFVIGDSIIRGELVLNNELITEVANQYEFTLVDDIKRNIQKTRKAFNPSIGRIKSESILIFRSPKK